MIPGCWFNDINCGAHNWPTQNTTTQTHMCALTNNYSKFRSIHRVGAEVRHVSIVTDDDNNCLWKFCIIFITIFQAHITRINFLNSCRWGDWNVIVCVVFISLKINRSPFLCAIEIFVNEHLGDPVTVQKWIWTDHDDWSWINSYALNKPNILISAMCMCVSLPQSRLR